MYSRLGSVSLYPRAVLRLSTLLYSKHIETLLIVDAMTGQDAVRSGSEFNERIGLTGIIMTKMDGDARRGGEVAAVPRLVAQEVLVEGEIEVPGRTTQDPPGFVRGQGTVCLILGVYYAAALMLVGLQFGLVVGFIAGALTFIPYVGALVGGKKGAAGGAIAGAILGG